MYYCNKISNADNVGVKKISLVDTFLISSLSSTFAFLINKTGTNLSLFITKIVESSVAVANSASLPSTLSVKIWCNVGICLKIHRKSSSQIASLASSCVSRVRRKIEVDGLISF